MNNVGSLVTVVLQQSRRTRIKYRRGHERAQREEDALYPKTPLKRNDLSTRQWSTFELGLFWLFVSKINSYSAVHTNGVQYLSYSDFDVFCRTGER